MDDMIFWSILIFVFTINTSERVLNRVWMATALWSASSDSLSITTLSASAIEDWRTAKLNTPPYFESWTSFIELSKMLLKFIAFLIFSIYFGAELSSSFEAKEPRKRKLIYAKFICSMRHSIMSLFNPLPSTDLHSLRSDSSPSLPERILYSLYIVCKM